MNVWTIKTYNDYKLQIYSNYSTINALINQKDPFFDAPDSLSSGLTFGAQGGRAAAIPAAGQELVGLSNGSCWTVMKC